MRVDNITGIGKSRGSKILLCITGINGEWIAKQWKRNIPTKLNYGEFLVLFGEKEFLAAQNIYEVIK
jgi:hypothetical protein